MGIFLNKGAEGFRRTLNSEIYVDKTDMIAFCNRVLGTEQSFICVSRPRRFGKTIAANMLDAYYEKGIDTRDMFEDRKLSKTNNWDRYLNTFNVIRIDMAALVTEYKSPEAALDYLEATLIKELKAEFGEALCDDDKTISTALAKINSFEEKEDAEIKEKQKTKFIIIIDEWDYFFRDTADDEAVKKRYLDFLRSIFKSDSAQSYIALAYITGILPIKRYESESALNNFNEYTMIAPDNLTKYVGFTEYEVYDLCSRYDMDFEIAKDWYNGYRFPQIEYYDPNRDLIHSDDEDSEYNNKEYVNESGADSNNKPEDTKGRGIEKEKKDYIEIYGPNSLVKAMLRRRFDNYWIDTAPYKSLLNYISMNYEGLRDDIVSMLCGNKVRVRANGYQNDMKHIDNKDDVLTVLIHLGYLAYDSEERKAYIPNKEVWEVFDGNIGNTGWNEVIDAIDKSEKLLQYTIKGHEEAVADFMDECHRQNFSSKKYNDENSLNCCIKLAYYAAKRDYVIVDEMPAGYGFADVLFIPKAGRNTPAILVELKWNKSAETAIDQIHDRKYPEALKGLSGEVVLVGITYDKKDKASGHECRIERTCVY